MAFEGLTEKLNNIFKTLRGKGKLSEKDVKEAMREVRLALLEADVNFKIVKEFINTVTEKAIGDNILNSLTPGQHVIKLVNEELVSLMGGSQSKLQFADKPPTVFMMAGLQGAGKTTACGKLAAQLKKQGKKPLLVACDVYRPAAIKQLQVVAGSYGVPVFEMGDKADPVEIAKKGVQFGIDNRHDLIIIDTAGRLHIDEELMEELIAIKAAARPTETLLVIDAMTGQDAVNVAEHFNGKLGVDGIIVSKLDGDTRGGAVLSVAKVTGKPVKFVGMGEKLSDLEPFYPDRMAQRILGMGDVMSLIEKAQTVYDEEQARELEKKVRKNELDLDDFLSQMQQIKKMGPLKNLLGMMPGMGQLNLDEVDVNEKDVSHIEAIIQSMTLKERRNPDIINHSRKRRIALGCGRSVQEINRLLKQFEQTKQMLKQFGDMGKGKGKGKKGGLKLPFMK